MRNEPTGSTTPQRLVLGALLLVGLPLVLATFHVGFQSSDDINYLNGAMGWIRRFPFVGDDHWTLRHTITIPTALAVRTLGLNEFAVSLTGMAYFVAFAIVNAGFAWRYLGPNTAIVATALILTLPGFPVVATYLSPDVPELFFVSTAFWLFRRALDDGPHARFWIASGSMAGLGYVNRPTAAAFVVFVALLWLVRPIVPRRRYLWMGLAFVAVVGIEWTYLTAMTHDPLYRTRLDLHHDVVDRFREASRISSEHRLIDKEGNLSVDVYVDPVLNLFVSQKYVWLFWLSIPGAVLAWHRRREPVFTTLATLVASCAVAFLFVAANPKLYLVPRYFIVPAWGAAMVGAWWIAALWASRRRRLAAVVLVVALGSALVSLSLEDTRPRAVERTLVRWVATHAGPPIYTDIETFNRSEYLLRFAGQPLDRVSSDRPPPGASFFFNAQRVAQCASTPRCRARADDFRPRPDWTVEETFDAPLRPGVALLGALGLRHVLPADVAARLFDPPGKVVVYRIPG